jgi:hypothetical protein
MPVEERFEDSILQRAGLGQALPESLVPGVQAVLLLLDQAQVEPGLGLASGVFHLGVELPARSKRSCGTSHCLFLNARQ